MPLIYEWKIPPDDLEEERRFISEAIFEAATRHPGADVRMFGFPYPYPQPPSKPSTLPCPPPMPEPDIECPYGDQSHYLRTDDYGTCRLCGASRSDRDRLWRQLGRESPET